MGYTQVFGGQNINPAQLSYVAYDVDANLTVVWPLEAAPDDNVAADKIDLTMQSAGLKLTMPPANQATVGQDVLIRNTGSETFSVRDADDTEIGSVASGEEWYFWITDNSTEAGTWAAVQFGMGTSSATAASLAGAGLRALTNRLDQNLITVPLLASYNVTQSDRAKVLQNNGGAITFSFDDHAVLGNGWFCYCINDGSGSLTLSAYAGHTIDGSATKVLAPTETAMIFSDGTNLHSLGYGRSIVNTVTGTSINAAGSGVLSLTTTEIAAQVQDISGTLTGDRTLDYGGGVGYWFVWNNTAGAFDLTARVNSLDTGVIITQGNYTILRSNGTNMEIAFTATTGTVTSVATSSDLTGGPITSTGTIGLANTTVAAGSYGAANKTITTTVDAKGRIQTMAAPDIAITGSQVTDLTSIINAAIAAALLASTPVGTIRAKAVAGEETGWLYAGGGTIGNAASNASSRANADTQALFTALWDSDTNLLIYNSAGVLTSRGGSANADWLANKALALPDYRGRAIFGRDNMGPLGAANRITNGVSGIVGTSLGATGGDERQQQHNHGVTDTGHIHGVTDPTHAHSITYGGPSDPTTPSTGGGAVTSPFGGQTSGASGTGVTVNNNTTGISIQNTGAGNSQNMPPAAICNVLIKYA